MWSPVRAFVPSRAACVRASASSWRLHTAHHVRPFATEAAALAGRAIERPLPPPPFPADSPSSADLLRAALALRTQRERTSRLLELYPQAKAAVASGALEPALLCALLGGYFPRVGGGPGGSSSSSSPSPQALLKPAAAQLHAALPVLGLEDLAHVAAAFTYVERAGFGAGDSSPPAPTRRSASPSPAHAVVRGDDSLTDASPYVTQAGLRLLSSLGQRAAALVAEAEAAHAARVGEAAAAGGAAAAEEAGSVPPLTPAEGHALLQILLALSRTKALRVGPLHAAALPHVDALLAEVPPGLPALHALAHVARSYMRAAPDMGPARDAFVGRLRAEVDEVERKLRRAGQGARGGGSGGRGGGGGPPAAVSSAADEVRRLLQPLIGCLWYLALATHWVPPYDKLLGKGIRVVNLACDLATRGGGQGGSSKGKKPAPPTSTAVPATPLWFNRTDVGRLSALQLGVLARRALASREVGAESAAASSSSTASSSSSATASPYLPPSLAGPLLDLVAEWHASNDSRVQPSSTQAAVRRALVEVCGRTRLPAPEEELRLDVGLVVDFGWALVVDDDDGTDGVGRGGGAGARAAAAQGRRVLPVDPQGRAGVALEVDGPTHFVSAAPGVGADGDGEGEGGPAAASAAAVVLDGPTQYKYFLLESFGWQVVHVPYGEWASLPDTPLARQQYLLARLRETPLREALAA
jgi:hypothetical protein